ncbi:MAG: hypothetical protein SPI75_05200, partial [Sodaliphilus sp.]|nr:hypothetical protein [Sodaliphilus sp.]
EQSFPVRVLNTVKPLDSIGYHIGKKLALILLRGLITQKIQISIVLKHMLNQSRLANSASAIHHNELTILPTKCRKNPIPIFFSINKRT